MCFREFLNSVHVFNGFSRFQPIPSVFRGRIALALQPVLKLTKLQEEEKRPEFQMIPLVWLAVNDGNLLWVWNLFKYKAKYK